MSAQWLWAKKNQNSPPTAHFHGPTSSTRTAVGKQRKSAHAGFYFAKFLILAMHFKWNLLDDYHLETPRNQPHGNGSEASDISPAPSLVVVSQQTDSDDASASVGFVHFKGVRLCIFQTLPEGIGSRWVRNVQFAVCVRVCMLRPLSNRVLDRLLILKTSPVNGSLIHKNVNVPWLS